MRQGKERREKVKKVADEVEKKGITGLRKGK